MELNLDNHSHRRLNILTNEWIQVSPHRAKRPWQGQKEESEQVKKTEYDPECYLCPGNIRAGGNQNPAYASTFVFTNDFSALQMDVPNEKLNRENMLIAHGERGTCRVLCFSPRHDLTLPELDQSQLRKVVDLWVDEYRTLGQKEEINYVQIFENKGQIMGCSNPHPHGQIWAQQTIPDEPAKEYENQKRYFEKQGTTLLEDYLALELDYGDRMVVQNRSFAVVVPFWAFWPFETLIISKRPFGRFTDMREAEKDDLAEIIQNITIRYDNIFNISFPYSAGFHPAPTDGNEHPEWHFHMHFYPPLLRSATVKKFRVGYEMLGTSQRDITPEKSAGWLSRLSGTHYKKK